MYVWFLLNNININKIEKGQKHLMSTWWSTIYSPLNSGFGALTGAFCPHFKLNASITIIFYYIVFFFAFNK